MSRLEILCASLIFIVACSVPEAELEEDEFLLADTLKSVIAPEPDAPEDNMHIWDLAGEFVVLQEVAEGGSPYYGDPCNFNPYDIRIAEISEYSGEWEIDWLGEVYPIASVEKKNGSIHIITETESSITFLFTAIDELLWSFTQLGYKESNPVVKLEYLQHYDFKPCEDAAEIMKFQPTTWYELTEIEDELVLFEPCFEPPGGITIGDSGETIEFWGAGDPYEIVSMSKSYDRISIIYKAHFDSTLSTITMHHLSDKVLQFGTDDDTDPHYVHEDAKEEFPSVDEECDEGESGY